jgi:hypothetical protein
MAKRAPADEPEYNPLGLSLVRDVMGSAGQKGKGGEEPHPPAGKASEPPPPPPGPVPEVAEAAPVSEPVKGRRPSSAGQEKLSFSPPIRVLLPKAEREELDQLVVRLAGELGTRVKLSHLLRACLSLLRHSEEQLLKRARKAGGLVRPTNHEAIALAEFEEALTELVGSAFRETPYRKPGQSGPS